MTDNYDSACTDLAELLIASKDDFDLAKAKKRVSARYGLSSIPKNSDILAKLPKDEKIIKKVQRKPVRAISGVAVVAVMTSPSECPHGRCMMCPGGPKSDFNSPQSYVGAEPAALRGVPSGARPAAAVAGPAPPCPQRSASARRWPQARPRRPPG